MWRPMTRLALVGLGLCLLPGCARKPAKTAADLSVETRPVTPPAPATAPGGAPSLPLEDPLAGDLDAVNEYVRRQGLLGDVYFAYDEAELSPEARQRLADNARFLDHEPAFEVTIEGHCDERGTPEYNLALGERRAQAAASYLTALGIDRSRLRTTSYGEERSLCTESDETCWQQNRRDHFVLTGRRVD